MSPIVYIREGDFRPLKSKSYSVKGVAYGMDEDSVFHAFVHVPRIEPPGVRYPCTFQYLLREEDINAFRTAAAVTSKLISSEIEIQVFIRQSETLKGKAYLVGPEAIECEIKLIPEQSDLFSRSKGLLETDALAKKKVGIVGLGSGGSPVALELAKAGIGEFILIDFDRLELSNIARHVCGINDLGRLKTNAVRDAILQKNPYANVSTLEIDVNKSRDQCFEALSKVDLIICASDNDQSRFFINEISLKFKIPAIFGRAITRAIGGDVLRVRPFKGPCYSCLYSQNVRREGSDDEEISQEKQAKNLSPDYTSDQELKAVIQVGLASDIAPISNLMVKLALVELSRGLDSGISSLEEDFVSDFYIWANRRENVYESWSRLEFNFNKPSILRWYGAKIARDPNCMICGFESL